MAERIKATLADPLDQQKDPAKHAHLAEQLRSLQAEIATQDAFLGSVEAGTSQYSQRRAESLRGRPRSLIRDRLLAMLKNWLSNDIRNCTGGDSKKCTTWSGLGFAF